MTVKTGIYRHYKGYLYRVLGVACHTEDSEQLVIYVDDDGVFWARPLEMFQEKVELDDGEVPRFTFLREIQEGKLRVKELLQEVLQLPSCKVIDLNGITHICYEPEGNTYGMVNFYGGDGYIVHNEGMSDVQFMFVKRELAARGKDHLIVQDG